MQISKSGVIKGEQRINPNIVPGTLNTEIQYEYPASSYVDRFAPTSIIVPTASQYVLSFYAKSTVAGDIVRAHWYSPNTTTRSETNQGIVMTTTDGQIDFTLSTKWEKYWVVWTQSETTTVKHLIFPRMGSSAWPAFSGTGIVSVKCVKLEEGNKPTLWVPCVKDPYFTGNAHCFMERSGAIENVKFYSGCLECNNIVEL